MTLSLTFEIDYKRIISAVINDSRNVIPEITNQPGTVIYAYAQAQIAQVVRGVLVYRIGSSDGNLGGYLALQTVNGGASILLLQLRPAYQGISLEISQFISNFITSNQWKNDLLT